MPDTEKRDFVVYVGKPGELVFLNLAQIQMARFEHGKCEIEFTGAPAQRFEGAAAALLEMRIAERAMELNGTPIRAIGDLKGADEAQPSSL